MGNCETLVKTCACATGTCSVDQVRACVDVWFPLVCAGAATAPFKLFSEQTFLQISFGRNNFMTNISQSADGAVGLPSYVFLNPSVAETPDPSTSVRNYAFANNKALTALVQINQGSFVYAEWNWDKADTRCSRYVLCTVLPFVFAAVTRAAAPKNAEPDDTPTTFSTRAAEKPTTLASTTWCVP